MTKQKTAVIILAAGLGTRMKSSLPKVMHPLAGRPMIANLLECVADLGVERTVVVIGNDMDQVAAVVHPHPCVVQGEQRGTGHAVMMARDALDGFIGDILVLFGGDPLITVPTLQGLIDARRAADAAVAVLGFRPDDPALYGRLIVDDDGALQAIVEARDATTEQLAIGLCNSGVMAIDSALLFGLLDRVKCDNAKSEYYLTDIIALACADGRTCTVAEGYAEELIGVDTRADLARAEAVMQDRLRSRAMDRGATLSDPTATWFSWDTRLGRDVIVGPHVFFGPGVTVGDGARIEAFCHIEGATIEAGARIGPFARLRPGTAIGEDARIGNFVEIKKATIEPGAKVSHLSYIGDARIGAGANIGAGTITCNYDGFSKSYIDIGAGAFIGSNTALVAPVVIGAGAIIGAGSVITADVGEDALALTRPKQKTIENGANRIRAGKKTKSGNNK